MANRIQLALENFDLISHWSNPIQDLDIFSTEDCVRLFDQNGYHLTPIEQLYAEQNGYPLSTRRHETVIRKPWLTLDRTYTGAHINHSDLFERKGYTGEALEQLRHYVKHNNLLWKIIKMKPKWGIDISIDYVDEKGNVFEVFHYEWDSFEYEPTVERKLAIENFILTQDWNMHAVEVLKRKSEWFDLDFFGQSKWRTDFYNIPPEKFKHIIWDN
jgi:hypothetical protein